MQTDWKREWRPLAILAGVFLVSFYLPVGKVRFDNAVTEALQLVRWYAREHVLLCLIPAFYIAGAIAVFVGQASIMKYLGPKANKALAYGVASVSGTVLAVCSCTVLPLFAGIYRMGAGLGPATAFLYAGPAINVLAIILTARVLGLELGVARGIGAILFSVIIGLLMHLIFRKEEMSKVQAVSIPALSSKRTLIQNGLAFAAMIAILVFANWGDPGGGSGFWADIYPLKWIITGVAAGVLAFFLNAWFEFSLWRILFVAIPTALAAILLPTMPIISFAIAIVLFSVVASTSRGEPGDWFSSTWGFAKQMMPLLFFGVLIAGALLGRPGNEGLIPSQWVQRAVGGNSIQANLFASVAGAFMYFATLTEIPILQGLIGNGMGKGPALALLLAGPALSLPNMLIIRSVMGTRRTVVLVLIVVIMSTISGTFYGALF